MIDPSFHATKSAKEPTSCYSRAQALLEYLLEQSIVLAEDIEALPAAKREGLSKYHEPDSLLEALTDLNIITDYQAGRISAGTYFGLVLGNYRILNRLGAGGMGVVFKAEHIQMRKQVAIKALPSNADMDPRILRRFKTEILRDCSTKSPQYCWGHRNG